MPVSTSLPLLLPFTSSMLLERLGGTVMRRARSLIDNVSALKHDDAVLSARVSDAQSGESVEVQIVLPRRVARARVAVTDEQDDGEVWNIAPRCSCERRGECEHAVAVMLAALRAQASAQAQAQAQAMHRGKTARTYAGHARLQAGRMGWMERMERMERGASAHQGGGVGANGGSAAMSGKNGASERGAEVAPRVIDRQPIVRLSFDTLPTFQPNHGRYGRGVRELDFGVLCFDYDGISVMPGSNATLSSGPHGELVRVVRWLELEALCVEQLKALGFATINSTWTFGPQPFPSVMWGLPDVSEWPNVIREGLPGLRAQGWRVEMTPGFHYNITDIDDIETSVRLHASGWFDVEMGVALGEQTLRLEPLLADLFRRDKRWLAASDSALKVTPESAAEADTTVPKTGLESIDDEEWIDLRSPIGERFRIRAGRLKPIVRVLVDLFAGMGQGGPMAPISVHDIGRLSALAETGHWQFHGDASVQAMIDRLKDGPSVESVSLPAGLRAVLRTYQHEGVNWMQFLRANNLSGVLADDMGLGKTVQTLAHILIEKESGRMDRPVLIVVPTTLVHNWCDEARRFTPDLSVLDLHGPRRKERFGEIGTHDIVVTTYALMWRDHAVLTAHDFHLLILDEAQYVKNVSSKAASAIRDVRSRHRLCLSGTPLENHLGELWAQFDFLMPGFLGTQRDFTKLWRKPIEKEGDQTRLTLLRNRVRPFMLRRRKSEVARELPAKTIMVQTVDLEGAQRDLYESMRVSMQARVRAAMIAQGFARSHILVLDALLKLRQVCCDPRLLKMAGAEAIRDSAKLEWLTLTVPELIASGRRVLIFSQFTEMLALIAESFDAARLSYVTLTGSTTDRVTPVERFQRGEVPLFLISLKAGGVGLNLTAADTVIHYDPWWNPAAENQATDRAHRLGQDKPVFVYKLIASGTIEEKIVALQERKAALANNVLSEDAVGATKFSEEELTSLFAPIT